MTSALGTQGTDVLPTELDNVARLRHRAASGATDTGARRRINWLNGTNTTWTITDSATNEEVTVSVSSATNTEDVQDIVAGLLVAGANITLTYNDAANTLTVDVSGLTESVQDIVGALTGFGGSGLTFTYDDAGNAVSLAVNAGNGTTITADAIDVDWEMYDKAVTASQTIPAGYVMDAPLGVNVPAGSSITIGSGGSLVASPGGQFMPHTLAKNVTPTADETTTAVAYANLPASSRTQLVFVKQRADTDLVVDFSNAGFYVSASANTDFGISVDGAAATKIVTHAVAITTRAEPTGFLTFSNVGAGQHTIEVQFQTSTGTAHFDTRSTTSLKVTETYG